MQGNNWFHQIFVVFLYLLFSVRMEQEKVLNVLIIWRGKHLNLEMNKMSKVHELGEKLQKLTNVSSGTLRLLVPQPRNRSSVLISPFSDEHSSLSLLEAFILEVRSCDIFLCHMNARSYVYFKIIITLFDV